MEPIVVAGALLVPSTIVFLLGCTLALYRTVRSPGTRRVRPLPSHQSR